MSDTQWTYLGLSHNPFTEPHRDFFPGADRDSLLNKIRHLNRWSRRILAVTGPHGVGKTSMFRTLSGSLETGVVAARVNGTLVSRAGDVLNAVLQGFGVAAQSGADNSVLMELIIGHLNQQRATRRTSLILVDDAQLLGQRAVDDLVSLCVAGAHLLLFAEPQFIEALDRSVSRHNGEEDSEELLWAEMLLSPFSPEQTIEYLEWRFEEAGYSGRMPYTEEQAHEIHSVAQGYPGRVDHAANEQLMLMTLGNRKKEVVPRRHLYLVAGLVAALGLVVWLYSPDSEDSVVDTAANSVVTQTQEDADQSVDSFVAQRRASDEQNQLDQRRIEQQRAERQRAEQQAQADKAVAEKQAQLDRAKEKLAQAQQAKEQQAAAEQAKAEQAKAEQAKAEHAKQQAAARLASEEADREAQAARANLADLPTDADVQELGARSASWLVAQADGGYTIQLIGYTERSAALAYVRRQKNRRDFAMFKTLSQGRTVYVISYGYYASQSAADAAAAELPAEVGRIEPWVRPIGSVKTAISSIAQD